MHGIVLKFKILTSLFVFTVDLNAKFYSTQSQMYQHWLIYNPKLFLWALLFWLLVCNDTSYFQWLFLTHLAFILLQTLNHWALYVSFLPASTLHSKLVVWWCWREVSVFKVADVFVSSTSYVNWQLFSFPKVTTL